MMMMTLVFVTRSSLELCAINSQSGRSVPVSVCKMQALQCMGKNLTIADHSACQWPQRATTGCANCHIWETCEGKGHQRLNWKVHNSAIIMHILIHTYSHTSTDQTNECRCKDSADCSVPGSNVCVRVGEDVTTATQTMSECEAGLRRCKGEKVSVVNIQPCTSWGTSPPSYTHQSSVTHSSYFC